VAISLRPTASFSLTFHLREKIMAGRNFDYPKPVRGRMAKNALRDMAKQAAQLDKALIDEDTLPAWVDYYIATSSDRMNTVGNYMQGELKRFQASTPEQQAASYGNADAMYSEVMLSNYGANYGDVSALSGAFDDWLEKAREQVSEWTGVNHDRTEDIKKLGRIALYAYIATMPLAAGVAYYKTKSIPQAVGAGFFSIPYLILASSQALLK